MCIQAIHLDCQRRMWGRKSEGLYQGLRLKWLGGEFVKAARPELARDDVIAVMMEFRAGREAATLVGAEDGTASLYLESGGGMIGMGFHVPTAAACLALVGCARSYLELLPVITNFELPAKGRTALRIVTRAGIHSAEFVDKEITPDVPIAPLATAAEHLLTNARMLDERRKQGGIKSHVIYVHVFSDGGTCVLVPPLADGTWLTPAELKRVLEVAKSHDDRLQVYVEPGDSGMQAPVQKVITESGMTKDSTAPERLLGYSGGTTTLLNAVEDARIDIAEDLIRRGVGLEAQDARGYTALILAAYRGRVPILRFLVQAGANINALDRHGNTVLLFAAQNGDVQVVRMLVDKGADLNARGQNGYTALKVAKLTRHVDVAEFLQSRGAQE